MPKKLMLVDGNSIINRAFYALPPLSGPDGEPTNGVHGFFSILLKFLDEEKPDYLVAAFDLKGKTFRHLMYDEYKAGRKPMPDDLRPQIPMARHLLELMNVRVETLEGYEADDILGTLAAKAEASGLEAVVVTGDKDLLQTASELVTVRIPKTKGGRTEVETYTPADVLEKIGVTPKEYIDVKALMGDSSDNIPGIPGIGEKTAVKLIQEYKTLDACLENAETLKPPKASKNLIENKDLAILSRKLSVIATDAPVELDLEASGLVGMWTQEAKEEFKRLGLKRILARFDAEEKKQGKKAEAAKPKPSAPPEKEVQAGAAESKAQDQDLGSGLLEKPGLPVPKPLDSKSFVPQSSKSSVQMSFDDPLPTEVEAVSLASDNESLEALRNLEGPAAFDLLVEDGFAAIGVASEKGSFAVISGRGISAKTLVEAAKGFLEGPCEKVAFDIKKQATFAAGLGLEISAGFDVMLAAYLLDASKGSYELPELASDLANMDIKEIFWAKKGRVDPRAASRREIEAALTERASAILALKGILEPKLAEKGQLDLLSGIEIPLAFTLARMERAGMRVDKKELAAFGEEVNALAEKAKAGIFELSGEVFNVNSPQQLSEVLFVKLGLKGGKKTAKGFSTAVEVLEKLKGEHPVIEKVLEYRTYSKLMSTYVEGLAVAIGKDGLIHTTFSQTAASTGRLSSLEPNLQNIPIRTDLGRNLRKAFKPREGFLFLDGDYSQIELRILAHMSGDETMINAFNEGQDIHRLTASQVFNTPLDEVTPAQRSGAKAVNFGIVYGIGAYSLGQDLGITKKEAEQYINGYFTKYPKVKTYLDQIVQDAKDKGYAETLYGRRRPILELRSSNFSLRSFGERVAMNMPIQGTAADIIKIAMINVDKRLKAEGLKTRLVLQVHDELLLEAPVGELEIARALLEEEMEAAAKLSVVLEADIHDGGTWYDSK